MLEMNQRMTALDLGFREALLDSSGLDPRLAAAHRGERAARG